MKQSKHLKENLHSESDERNPKRRLVIVDKYPLNLFYLSFIPIESKLWHLFNTLLPG
jgi:hypothetical protein